MPFKTKSKKIAAAQHRFFFAQNQLKITTTIGNIPESKETKQETFKEKLTAVGQFENMAYVRHDLVKILIAALLIITAQIVAGLTLA